MANAGSVDVGGEVDPYAIPCWRRPRTEPERGQLLRHVVSTEDPSGQRRFDLTAWHAVKLKLVRELRADRGPVLLITAVPTLASTDAVGRVGYR